MKIDQLGVFSDSLTGYDVSADGSVVVGAGGVPTAFNNRHAFRWDAETGAVDLGTFGGARSIALGVSYDGSAVVGSAEVLNGDNFAFRWTEASGMMNLGSLGDDYSAAYGASANGAVVVGEARVPLAGTHAFRWENGTMVDLGALNGGLDSRARDVSANGSVVVGGASDGNAGNQNRAFLWTEGVGMTSLGTLHGNGSIAEAVSSDGSVVVGRDVTPEGFYNTAFRWEAGVMVDLGTLDGWEYSTALDVSADGSVVVGASQNLEGETRPWRWTESTGLQSMDEWFADAGLEFISTNFADAVAVSADGSTALVNVFFSPSGEDGLFLASAGEPPEILVWDEPGGGMFSDPENWLPEQVPGEDSDIAFDIVNGGYVVEMDQDADVSNATVEQGTVSWRFNGNAGGQIDIANDLTVGVEPSVRGGLDVIGGMVTADSVEVGIAPGADGLVTLREGAALDFNSLTVGGTASGSAQLYAISGAMFEIDAGDVARVIGSASQLGVENLSIGEGGVGVGTLSVEDGALATVDQNLNVISGDVVVAGSQNDAEATLEVASLNGAFFVEEKGSLTVSSGGVVRIGSLIENPQGDLVVNATSPDEDFAPVRVAGEDSQLSAFGTIAIGVEQTGRVEVEAGGNLAAKQIALGSSSTTGVDGELALAGSGSHASATTIRVGEEDAGAGLLKIAEAATLEVTQQLSVTNGAVLVVGTPEPPSDDDPLPHLMVGTEDEAQILVGRQGRLAVTEGARVQIGSSLFDLSADLFVDADAPVEEAAPVSITGEDSSLLAFGEVAIGGIDDGRMEVTFGGSLTAQEITLGSALFDGVFGQLDVRGIESEVFAHEMVLGDQAAGAGALYVEHGASVDLLNRLELIRSQIIVDGGELDRDSRLFVGESSDQGGVIQMGPESRFMVSDGAKVEVGSIGSPNGEVVVNSSAPSNESAPLLVTGEDSRLQAFGSVAIGFFDNGVAAVEDGGALLAQQVSIGVTPVASGELTVGGVGSLLTSGVVTVGGESGGLGTLQTEDGGAAEILQRLVVNESGAVWVTGESSIVIGDPQTTPVPGSVVIGPGGELWGKGTVFADREVDGGVDNLGMVFPGNSPGTLTIDGDYTQGETGGLVIEIAGTEADLQHDVLNVLGDTDIGGQVVFKFIDGFAPTAGDTYMFLETGGDADLAGADFRIQGLLPGFEYLVDPEVPGGPFMLTALTDGVFLDPLAGDFNEDGAVDGNDLLALQRNYGLASNAMQADGDADGNGVVDDVDLSIWEDQFGNVAAAAPAVVPEPATWRMSLLAAFVFVRRLRRRSCDV